MNLRFGAILSPKEGALAKMLLPFKLGGGRVGGGRQFWIWIPIDDAASAIHHALMTASLSGSVNAVAANPVTNAEFTKTLGRVLRRPTIVPMPAFAARLALGEHYQHFGGVSPINQQYRALTSLCKTSSTSTARACRSTGEIATGTRC